MRALSARDNAQQQRAAASCLRSPRIVFLPARIPLAARYLASCRQYLLRAIFTTFLSSYRAASSIITRRTARAARQCEQMIFAQ